MNLSERMVPLTAERKELFHVAELVPDDKVGMAICALEDFLEPNEETRKAIQDVMSGQNLIGPFDSVEAMWEALLQDDDEV